MLEIMILFYNFYNYFILFLNHLNLKRLKINVEDVVLWEIAGFPRMTGSCNIPHAILYGCSISTLDTHDRC